MAKKTKLILLRLEGVLQAWGDHSKWDERDSGDFPSKSGVVGLLACAMGLERGDPEIGSLSQELTLAVRADRPGVRMLDFHTVQGKPRLTTASGGQRSESASTIVSRRWYLQDASFLAVIETAPEWQERILAGLNAPKWPLFLGRKSCVPSRPVLEGVTEDYAHILDALFHYPAEREPGKKSSPAGLRYECDSALIQGSSYSRPDERLDGQRNFALRRVATGVIPREVD